MGTCTRTLLVSGGGGRVGHAPAADLGIGDAHGYVRESLDRTICHTGDTEHDPCLPAARDKHPDALLVPAKGQKGNMDSKQAARLAAEREAPFVVPMHSRCLQPADDLVERFLTELAYVASATAPACMEPGAIAHLPLKCP